MKEFLIVTLEIFLIAAGFCSILVYSELRTSANWLLAGVIMVSAGGFIMFMNPDVIKEV